MNVRKVEELKIPSGDFSVKMDTLFDMTFRATEAVVPDIEYQNFNEWFSDPTLEAHDMSPSVLQLRLATFLES